MRATYRLLRGTLALPLALAGTVIAPSIATACADPAPTAADATVTRREIPVVADGKVMLKMSAPAVVGRDGRYHDATMELINPTPDDYRSATLGMAFLTDTSTAGGTDVRARYLRLRAESAAGLTAIPLTTSCDGTISGTIVNRVALSSGTTLTVHLRLAAAKSAPSALRAFTAVGTVDIADSSFRADYIPGPDFRIAVRDNAAASEDRVITQSSQAKPILGAPAAPSNTPTAAHTAGPPAPATPTTAPASPLAPRLTASPTGPGDGSDSATTGLIAIVAGILLISSLGAAAMLRRTV
jgi:hypothetical protein